MSGKGSCLTCSPFSMASKGTTLGPATFSRCTWYVLEARLHPKLALWSARRWQGQKCRWYVPLDLWRCTYMEMNTSEPACSHPMCLMESGPGKRVGISLSCIGDDDHIIIQNNSITHNIPKATLVDTKISSSNFCLLNHKTNDFLVVFIRYNHYVFPGESSTTPMTFSNHYKLYKHLWKRLGCDRPSWRIVTVKVHR